MAKKVPKNDRNQWGCRARGRLKGHGVTGSRALSGNGHVAEATKIPVETAALELGYVVSPNDSRPATGRTKNVGVVIPFLNRWFFSSVIEGAEHALLSYGCDFDLDLDLDLDLTLYNVSGGGDERRRDGVGDGLSRADESSCRLRNCAPGRRHRIGIHIHDLSDFFGLSTVAQFPTEQGVKSVEILMDELHPGRRDKASTNTPLRFELIVSSSTARPDPRLR
jgi:DNA-binding LacI/PurR family transcriptional regulator